MRSTRQRELFERPGALPDGFVYRPEFLTPHEEKALLLSIRDLPFAAARYRSFTAKRRIVSFGSGYDFTGNVLLPAPPIPAILHPVRARISTWSGIPEAELVQCTVAEYQPGTQLGWHRDVPSFGAVAGISLASACRMRLRPYPHVPGSHRRPLVVALEPRSAYVFQDVARWRWQHAISPTKALRYSITFRTMRTPPPVRASRT
jgi:alkylated DNA repair dioxygenase AlkB